MRNLSWVCNAEKGTASVFPGQWLIVIIRAHRSPAYVDAAYCYRPSSAVCRSVSVSVCQTVCHSIVSPAHRSRWGALNPLSWADPLITFWLAETSHMTKKLISGLTWCTFPAFVDWSNLVCLCCNMCIYFLHTYTVDYTFEDAHRSPLYSVIVIIV